MSNLSVCIQAVLPSFLLMVVGFAAKKRGIIKEELISAMNSLTFKLFLPVLAFYNIVHSDLTSCLRPKLMIFSSVMILLILGLSTVFVNCVEKDRSRKGVMIQGLYRSNYLVIGLSIASMLVPGEDPGVITVLAVVTVPLYNIIAVFLLSYFREDRVDPKKLIITCFRSPLIIACFLGLAFLLSGIRIPAPIDLTLRDLGRIGSPLALVLLGAFFRFEDVQPHLKQLLIVLFGRLIVLPMIFLPISILFGFRGIELATILVLTGAATAVTSFPMAQQLGGDTALAGHIVVFSSIGCTFTIFVWSMLLKNLGFL